MPSMDLFKRREKSGERPSDDDSEQLSRAVGVTRRSIFGKIGSILGQDQITTATWEELEEVLIGADVGVQTALSLVERVKSQNPRQPEDVRALLREELVEILNRAEQHHDSDNDTLEHQVSNDVKKPYVILVVGVNGTGKTTISRSFLSQLDSGFNIAYIFNPCLSSIEFASGIVKPAGPVRTL